MGAPPKPPDAASAGAAHARTNRHARNLALRSIGACSGGGDVKGGGGGDLDVEVDAALGGDDGDEERRRRHPLAVRTSLLLIGETSFRGFDRLKQPDKLKILG